jgi:hypothetical protein
MTYDEYLRSDEWQQKRTAKLRRCRRCAICGSVRNLDVHHLIYRHLFDVTLADLRVLCRRCHEVTHELTRRGLLIFRDGDPQRRFLQTRQAVWTALLHGMTLEYAPLFVRQAHARHLAYAKRIADKVLPTADELRWLGDTWGN